MKKAYGITLFFTALCFVLSAVLPSPPLFRELGRKVSPVLQMRKVNRKFSAAGRTVLKIKARDVDVVVERAASDVADILVEVQGRFANDNREPLRVLDETDSLEIRVEENLRRKAWISNLAGPMRGNRLHLTLPATFSGRLIIENDSGATEVALKSLGEFSWESVSGNLDVIESEIFSAKLSSVSGSVNYDAVTSDLAVNLTSGDAKIRLQGFERFLSARADVSSISGNIYLRASAASSLRLMVSSMTGEAKSHPTLPKSKEPGTGTAFEGTIGAGANEVRIRSLSGNVEFHLDD